MGPAELRKSLSKTVRAVSRRHQGNPAWHPPRVQYPIWHVLEVFLTCVLEGVCPGILYERLKVLRGYRKSLGLPNRLISLSQLKKRTRTLMFQKALLELLKQSACRVLRKLGKQEVRVIAMDLTRLESDDRRDKKGDWGKDSRGFFWGYKLGLIMSQSGVVLGLTLTKAKWGEFNANRSLLKMARDVVQTSFGELSVDYLLCDSGFDGESTYQFAHQKLGARVICPPRRKRNPRAKTARNVVYNARSKTPHREADRPLWEEPETRDLFKKRSGAERLNAQLKDTGIRIHEIPPRWRGVKKLGLLCMSKLIVYNLILYANHALGRPIRGLKLLAA